MEIQFVGPLGKVTGSCTWMRDLNRNWSFLIDCGMQQGERTAPEWNAGSQWPFNPADIQFVVLTHAHIDHCGLIPALYRSGFKGTVYCTKETSRLAEVLLKDAARFPSCPFNDEDVDLVRWHTHGGKTTFGGYHPVDDDLFIRFFRSGHIIGAVSVTVAWGPKGEDQKSIVFSGDVGPGEEDGEILPVLRYPLHPKPGNFAVLESTYGDTVRGVSERSPQHRRQQLQEHLDRILETSGTLAIPAFSVGRTQDLMFDLHQVVAENPVRYSAIRFYLDSPSAAKVNEITLEALRETTTISHTGKVRLLWLGKQLFKELALDDKDPEHLTAINTICEMTLSRHYAWPKAVVLGNETARNWRPLFTLLNNRTRKNLPDGPQVILMGSGTCDGGAAAYWLPKLCLGEQNTIATSGYCASSTIGGQLLEMANVPLNQRQLQHGEIVWRDIEGKPTQSVPKNSIKALLCKLQGYSAHGDQLDLVNWLFENHRGEHRQVIGETVFLQHGENLQRKKLGTALLRKADEWGLNIRIEKPENPGVWYDLDSSGVPLSHFQQRETIEAHINRLKNELVMLNTAVAKKKTNELSTEEIELATPEMADAT